MKTTIPPLAQWHMFAGGSSAKEGKHGYVFYAPQDEYHIAPISSRQNVNRHLGYSLKYAATGGAPRGGHSGLWHDLGMFRSAASAAVAARAHYTASF
jgi:hypothetical protein